MIKLRIFRCVLVLLALFYSTGCLIDMVAGAFTHEPEEMATGLSSGTRSLLERTREGIEPGALRDFHTHIIGIGAGGTGAFINPEMESWLHPIKRLKYSVYKSAFDINDLSRADRDYVERLVRLIRNIPEHGKHRILAFDKHHSEEGEPDLEKTEFYTPNEYVIALAKEFPDVFLPTISVHPYRKDALEKLEKWSEQGARQVKWLPNAMNIDPTHAKSVAYFKKMKELDMTLLTHTGEEQAVDGDEFQRLGNPLLFRTALDLGVKVIMSHAASLGDDLDLDNPKNGRVSSFDLFLRLMGEKKYEGILFGDISATTQYNRLSRPVATLLQRKDLHHRLVNGSDYPLPAINILIRTRNLLSEGFITEEEREQLNEIYDYNPLLYDFAIKRVLRHPDTGDRFPASVFTGNPGLPD